MTAVGHARRFEHAPGKSALPPIATEMMSRETDEKASTRSIAALRRTGVPGHSGK